MFMIVEDCLPDSLGKNRGSAEAKQLLFPWFKKKLKWRTRSIRFREETTV